MKLLDTKDFAKAAKLRGIAGEGIARFLMTILKFNKVNNIYSKVKDFPPEKFFDFLIKELDLNFEISDEDLEKIPKTGPFITISNHPFGGIDGLLLVKIFYERRPDYKVMANFLLQKIKPIENFILPVNPFETHKDSKSSITGIKSALSHLNEGKCLGIFPAGEVSSYYSDFTGIADRHWQPNIIRFIKMTKVPIVPVYFQGANSRLFHYLGFIHPLLRTVKLPSELFNKKNKLIRIRIGNPITIKEQEEFTDIERFGRFLRAKTYSLGTALEVKKFFGPNLKRSRKLESVIPPVDVNNIKHEIKQIHNKYILFKIPPYSVYCAPSIDIPNIVNEIGRLRELTFREIGEGTNRKIDVDEFDLYYHHLFIWDEQNEKIVGAYRAGKGKDILEQYGIKGLYIQSLFRIENEFVPILRESIELGRSFIIKEYQKKPMPLFLLWKGILYFILKNPEYRYLIGPVSISNRFSKVSKSMIIRFIMTNYYNYDFAKYIKPRNKFKVNLPDFDADILMETASNDFNKLDKTIKDIEPDNIPIPVLLKKYIKLNAQIIGFNIDPKFNNALDGLILLDLFNVPYDTIASFSKEINDETILERFMITDSHNTE